MLGVQLYNALEAAFWFVLAILALARGRWTRGFTPWRQRALVAFLAAFGVSDLWEIFSGGWWQPPALLALKAVCFVGLAITAAYIYGTRWRVASR